MEIQTAITRILHSLGLNDLEIEFEKTGDGKLGGFVISPSFTNMTQSERQDLIWDALDRSLEGSEQSKITALLTLTPLEADIPPKPGAETVRHHSNTT